MSAVCVALFFFQAEDGIRDLTVTGVQTCALPICYPVFTRKQNTDVSYLACAKRLFTHADAIYPMFATHNAHTIAAVRSIANGGVYEHQKLHGMGDDLYAEVVPADRLGLPCRVYAPVGSHEDLLPYLVR